MKSWQRGNLLGRQYDVAIPAPLLDRVKQRRQSPDGEELPIKKTRLGSREIYLYPWDKMELGDYFLVPLTGRSEKGLRTAFYQSAARRDYEIAITLRTLPGGTPALRVTLVIIGVVAYKLAAEKHILVKDKEGGLVPKKFAVSDGKWKGRKRRWEKERRVKAKDGPKTSPKSPVWKDNDPALAVDIVILEKDTAVYVEPTEHVSPEEIRRRALAGEL